MRSKNVKIQVMYAVLFAMIGVVLNIVVNFLPIELRAKIEISSVYVVLSYIFIISYCVKHNRIVSAFFILTVISILFLYGQHILAIFDPNYLYSQQDYHILDGRISDASIITATFLAMECILILFSGFLCISNSKTEENIVNIKVSDTKLLAVRIVAIIALLVSLYPTIKYLLAQYALSEAYGYLGRRQLEANSQYNQILGVSVLEIYVSGVFLPSLYALMIAFRGHRHIKYVYILAGVYSVLYYLTGSRYELLQLLVTLFLIYYSWIKPFKFKDIKKYIPVALVAIMIFSLGGVIRNAGTEGISFIEAFEKVNVGEMLWEPGISFTTISNIIECCPSKVDFFFGKSLIGSIVQCLPPFLRFGYLDNISLHVSGTFAPLLFNTTSFGYGSSFIAEAYYNFGWFLYVFIFILGMCMGKIDVLMHRTKQSNSVCMFLLLATLSGKLVFSVRNDLVNIPRELLFSVGIIIVGSIMVENILKMHSRGRTDF